MLPFDAMPSGRIIGSAFYPFFLSNKSYVSINYFVSSFSGKDMRVIVFGFLPQTKQVIFNYPILQKNFVLHFYI